METDQQAASQAARESALSILRKGERFLLTGHMRPDGDCVGAQAALCRVLESLGKTVYIVNPDPVQAQFDYLSGECTYRTYKGGDLPAHDVVCLLDFSELQRTGALAEPIAKADSKRVVIDHHLFHGEPWWDAAYVDCGASATGLLVYRIAAELGVELDRVGALGVYTSLVTDTGWFKYSNTDAETLRVAGEMVAAGVDPHVVFGAIYQRNSRQQPRGVARALARLEYFAGGRLAVIDLPQAAAGEADLSDGDEVLDLLRAVDCVEVVLFLRELKEGGAKLSARSKGEFDVNRLARGFGGGGHAKASGATFKGSLAEAKQALVERAVAHLSGDFSDSGKPGNAKAGA